jgi:hypothetical protein
MHAIWAVDGVGEDNATGGATMRPALWHRPAISRELERQLAARPNKLPDQFIHLGK